METLAGRAKRCSGGNETSSRDQKDDFLSIACILLVAVILAAVIYFTSIINIAVTK